LEARGKGLLGITLRYPYEVRKEEEYFDDIPDEKIPKDMLDLASHIVETKAGHFDPKKFDDRYEDALKDLIKKKQEGKPIERPERRQPAKVINLMDALRRSVEASDAGRSAKAKARHCHAAAIRTADAEKSKARKLTYRDSPPSITRSIGRKPVAGAIDPLDSNRAMALLRLPSIAPGLMLAVAAWRH
jgi:DNA end-binding protein Ku